MAELLSVQVHAPVTLTSVNATSSSTANAAAAAAGVAAGSSVVEMDSLKVDCTGTMGRRLKKVDNATQDMASGASGTLGGLCGAGACATAAATRFDYLPKRPAVNIEFSELTYSVSEGRKKGDQSYDSLLFTFHDLMLFTSYINRSFFELLSSPFIFILTLNVCNLCGLL